MKRIIYPISSGGVAVVTPAGEIPIEEVARKDVPAGVPYKFIEISDLPSDDIFRSAWEMDQTNIDGYGIGHEAWMEEQKLKGENP